MGVGKLEDGRYYACYFSEWAEGVVHRRLEDGTWQIIFRCEDDDGPPGLAVVITEDDTKELVKENNEYLYEEMFGEMP